MEYRWTSHILNGLIFFLAVLFLIRALLVLDTGPAATPIFVCTIVIILITVLYFKEWKKRILPQEQRQDDRQPTTEGKPWWFLFALSIVYFFLCLIVGLMISTILFLLAAPYLCNYKNWKTIIVSCLFYVLLYRIGFEMFLGIRFPSGILFS